MMKILEVTNRFFSKYREREIARNQLSNACSNISVALLIAPNTLINNTTKDSAGLFVTRLVVYPS